MIILDGSCPHENSDPYMAQLQIEEELRLSIREKDKIIPNFISPYLGKKEVSETDLIAEGNEKKVYDGNRNKVIKIFRTHETVENSNGIRKGTYYLHKILNELWPEKFHTIQAIHQKVETKHHGANGFLTYIIEDKRKESEKNIDIERKNQLSREVRRAIPNISWGANVNWKAQVGSDEPFYWEEVSTQSIYNDEKARITITTPIDTTLLKEYCESKALADVSTLKIMKYAALYNASLAAQMEYAKGGNIDTIRQTFRDTLKNPNQD